MSKQSVNLVEIDDILEIISNFESGNFSEKLGYSVNSNLNPIIDKLNHLSAVLKAQAQFFERIILREKTITERVLRSILLLIFGFFISSILLMIFGQYFHVFNILIVFLIILDSGTYFGIFFSILYMFISDYFFIIPIGSVLDSKDGIQQLIINSVISILAAFLFNLLLRSYKYSKRSYLAINQEKKRYESLVKGLNESAIVAMTDRKGKIIFVNDMFCKVSGYSSDELICKTHKIINSDFHPPEFFKQMWQTILKEECGIMKFVIEGKMVLCIG